jgi:hypothetical protein
MAVRDILKIGGRVVGATGGFLVGGPAGAAVGYQIGATVGDAAAGPIPTETVKQSVIASYDPNAAMQKHPTSRVSSYNTEQSNPDWSDKATAIADPIVAGASMLSGGVAKTRVPTGEVMTKAPIIQPKLLDETVVKPLAGNWNIGSSASKITATPLADVSTALDDTNSMINNVSGILNPTQQPIIPNTPTYSSIEEENAYIQAANKNRVLSGLPPLPLKIQGSQSGAILNDNTLLKPTNIEQMNKYLEQRGL